MAVVSEETLKTYISAFSEEVKGEASSSGEFNEIALLNLIKERIGECKLINDPQYFYWSFKGASVYGYDYDEFDNSITVFQSDFGEPMHTILQRDAQHMTDSALSFIRSSVAADQSFKAVLDNEAFDLYDQIQQFGKSPSGISKFKIIIVSNGKRSSRAKIKLDSIGDIDVEQYYWDAEWIYLNCNGYRPVEDIIIDASDEDFAGLMDGGLACLPVPQSEDFFECYQCIVPGKLLAYIYREFGSPLLEGNVRSFLTTKTAINKEIQGTINKNPERFYIYNNGIAAVAASAKTELIDGVLRITRIEKIQIVNGGQTTASLAYSAQKRGADLSRITVPMKLTVIKPINDDIRRKMDEMIQKISKTSNSQNKVSDADFFANHPFHIKMKQFSTSCSQPGIPYSTYWFYERARGEYEQSMLFKTNAQIESFKQINPKNKRVTKQEFAKYYNLMKMNPDKVSKGSDSNFILVADDIGKQWDSSPEIFNEMFFKSVISVGELYRTLEPMISKKALDWFEGSYRANVLYYAISSMFWLIEKKGARFDLIKIWDKGITDALKEAMIELCHTVYDIITDPNRSIVNVTQYCKKPVCWQVVKDRIGNYCLPETAFAPYLISAGENWTAQKEARAEQKMLDEVTAYQMIMQAPYKGHWKDLVRYLISERKLFPELTDKKLNSIMKVEKIDSGKMASPSGSDCLLAVEWWNTAEKMGWHI